MKKREQFGVGEVLVSMPPGQSTVEQLLALQQALSQLEGIIQAGNIILLKTRALLLSNYPEVYFLNFFVGQTLEMQLIYIGFHTSSLSVTKF